jgi:ribosomal-protein-alanine N-acetyltransferase
MALVWQYWKNKASATQISEHLSQCGEVFVVALKERTDINQYAQKLATLAVCLEAWSDDTLIGLLALYCNDLQEKRAYISHVSTLPAWQGHGIATHLLQQAIQHAQASGIRSIQLEVSANNTPAIRLYEKQGFEPCTTNVTTTPKDRIPRNTNTPTVLTLMSCTLT